MRIVTGGAVNVRPVSGVPGRGGAGESPVVVGREEIGQGLAFTHPALGQHRRWSMARDAVLSLYHIARTLPRVRLTEFGRDIHLSFGVLAHHPAVVDLMIRVSKMKVSVALATELSGVGHGLILPSRRIEIRLSRRIVWVVTRRTINLRPVSCVCHSRVGSKYTVTGREKVA